MKSNTDHLSLRERNRQRIVQRIVDAALTLFDTVGYEQTTTDAIADKAEVSRGTLFNYFPTKTALLIPFAGQLYQKHVQPDLRAYLETQPATFDALHFLFTSIGEQVLTFPDIERALQQEFFPPPPPRLVQETYCSVGFFETLLTLVHYGQQRGELHSTLPAEKLAHYIGSLYVSLLFTVMQPHSALTYATEVESLLLFLRPLLLLPSIE